jgi:hypothetical protein
MGNHKKCCKSSKKITARDINDATRVSLNGYDINRAGVYEVCEDVDWTVARATSRAITIIASNVTLLFKNHTLRQVDHTVANTAAIVLAAGVENVNISGGSITEIAGQGISIQPGCQNVQISDMIFSKIGYNGSLLTIIIPVFFERQTSGVIAINVNPDQEPVSNVIISHCAFNDNGILDDVFPAGTNFGVIFSNFSKDITVQDCTFDNMFGADFGTAFIPINTNNTVMSRCLIRNVVSNREAVGFAPSICEGGVYEDITVQNAILKLKADAPEAHGAEGAKLSQCTDFVVRRCVAQDVHVQSVEPTVQDQSNTLAAQGFGTGSLGGHCQNVLFENCVVQNVTNDGGLIPENGPAVRTGGFTMQGGSNNIHFVGCSAENVTATIGRVMGFGTKRYKNAPNNTFVNCVANDIRGQSDAEGEYAAGFHLNSQNNRITGCTATNVVHSSGQGYGIVLDLEQFGTDPVTEAQSCILSGNKVEFNSTNGIADLTTAKNSAITGTYAAFNGAGGVGPNYQGLNPVTYTAATTQQDWTIPATPSALPAAGAALVNIDLHF